ncbi:MAG: TIGR02281 family clan AA aspartic protease [Pseudomonadota bacterium]|nr:TIGR02281 family clan AA aspartic protease [Pseudomonadota bacterium]
MGRLYLFIMLCLGMFGCMASNLPRLGSAARPKAAAEYASESGYTVVATPAREQRQTSDGNAVVLEREGDGHFYADVEVNGATLHMLVDTGASGVALSVDDARRAGIATTIGNNDLVGEGAGGHVYGNVVAIDRIRLGDTEAHDLTGVVLNGGSMSLLGQDFLRQFASVEISGDRMVLR